VNLSVEVHERGSRRIARCAQAYSMVVKLVNLVNLKLETAGKGVDVLLDRRS
jgi:hypothetical protein